MKVASARNYKTEKAKNNMFESSQDCFFNIFAEYVKTTLIGLPIFF